MNRNLSLEVRLSKEKTTQKKSGAKKTPQVFNSSGILLKPFYMPGEEKRIYS
jgi:hypothetical protein